MRVCLCVSVLACVCVCIVGNSAEGQSKDSTIDKNPHLSCIKTQKNKYLVTGE